MFGIFVLNFAKGYVSFQNKSRHYSSTTSQIQKIKAQNLAKESEARWIVKKSAGLFLWDLCTMPVFWKSAFCIYLLKIPGVLEKLEPIGSFSRGYYQFVRMFS